MGRPRLATACAIAVALLLGLQHAGAQGGLNSGLVGYWDLDQGTGTTAPDASAFGNTAGLVGPTWTASGRIAGGLTFDGGNDYAQVQDTNVLDLTATGTIAAWVRPAGTGWRSVIAKGNVNRDQGHNYALELNPANRVQCAVANGVIYLSVLSAAPVPLDAFHHLACVWSGGTLTVYVNGVASASTALTFTPAGNTSPLILGRWGTAEWLNGTLDEVRIYGRALTPAEVTALFNFSGGMGDATPPSLSLTGPAPGGVVSGAAVGVAATAADNVGVVGVQFRLDGMPLGDEDTTAPYSITWDTTTPRAAPHALGASARRAGNIADAPNVTVTVDNQPPTGAVVIDGGAAATASRDVTLTLSASDAHTFVTQMRFSNTGTAYSAPQPYATTAPWVVPTGNGTKTVFVQFADAQGNWSAAFTDIIELDGSGPVVSGLSAANVTNRGATIRWTTSEPATSQLEYGPTSDYGQVTLLSSTLVTSHAVVLEELMADTPYRYRVRSADGLGNHTISAGQTFTTLAAPDGTHRPLPKG